jgi:hypothetical protein
MRETLRESFCRELDYLDGRLDLLKVLTVAVRLPTGAIEVITNTSEIPSKIDYYLNAYDSDFKLKANPQVQIVGYMLV